MLLVNASMKLTLSEYLAKTMIITMNQEKRLLRKVNMHDFVDNAI